MEIIQTGPLDGLWPELSPDSVMGNLAVNRDISSLVEVCPFKLPNEILRMNLIMLY